MWKFSWACGNRLCMSHATLSHPWPDNFTSGVVDSDDDDLTGTCCLSWCWAPGLLPLAVWASCSSHFCLVPQLIPDSIVALWLFTLAQELLSHFRCWENEGSKWARFLHVSVPHTTGRQDIMWPYSCWWTEGCVGHFSLPQCRCTDAFQWEFLTVAAENF